MRLADPRRVAVPALVQLVDDDLSALDDEAPARLWDRALLDPLRELFARPGKGVRARLVEAAWHAAGGDPVGPPPLLPLLTEILHAGSLVIDDIEDGSARRRGRPALHHLVGVPLALNAGNLLYFWPHRLLERLELPSRQRLAVHEALARTLLDCHRGQALDLSVRVVDLARGETRRVVAATTRLKTGSLMAFAAWSGAAIAGAPAAVSDALAELGMQCGVALQMMDDLSGVLADRRRDKGDEDLRLARPTWVWAWMAEDLDDVSYAAALHRLRDIAAGAPSEPLRVWLRDELAVSGLARARAHFDQAARSVEGVVARPEALEAFRSELRQLEASYVGGP